EARESLPFLPSARGSPPTDPQPKRRSCFSAFAPSAPTSDSDSPYPSRCARASNPGLCGDCERASFAHLCETSFCPPCCGLKSRIALQIGVLLIGL
ncbi:hypothetical protein SORBI_3003G318800, partial [Sorghum bicolor]